MYTFLLLAVSQRMDLNQDCGILVGREQVSNNCIFRYPFRFNDGTILRIRSNIENLEVNHTHVTLLIELNELPD